MKNINRLLTLIIIFGLTLTGCETELDDPAGERNLIGATPVIENLDPSIFLAADKQNTFVAFDVTAGELDLTMDAIVEVSYDGGKERAQLSEFTIPATGLEVALTDVADALGISVDDMVGGAYVNIEVLTKAGDKYFRSAAAVNPLIACDYVPTDYPGTPNAASSGWGVDGEVTVTVDPTDDFTLLVSGLATIDGCVEDGGPLPLIVDPASYNITVPRTILASSEGWIADYGYTNIAYGGTGTLNTCSREIQLLLEITVDQGSFGEYAFTITY
ncbi:MAG: hypothetical protein U5K32_12615 [Bacteroidales bacterium]|nr:hypothetical protein [Bacteroidales bacterium]